MASPKKAHKKQTFIEEKKEDPTVQSLNGNNDKTERKYYTTKENIVKLNSDKSFLVKLQANFKAIKAELLFEDNMIIVRQVHIDKEKVLRMIEEVIGLAWSEAEFERLVEELASIEHPRKKLLADPSQTFSNFLVTTEKGALFSKHETGAARKQWLSLKADRLYWRDKEKGRNHLNRSMEMKDIVKIKPGKTTKLLKHKKLSKFADDLFFSIIGVRKTLDLQCDSRLMRDEWFTYIEFTHRHYVPAKRRTMHLKELDNPLDDDLDMVD